MHDLVLEPDIRKLVDELGAEFDSALDRTVIAGYVGTAVRDLRGSICQEALPEMVCRLAGYRLAELVVERGPGDPARAALPTTRNHTRGGVR